MLEIYSKIYIFWSIGIEFSVQKKKHNDYFTNKNYIHVYMGHKAVTSGSSSYYDIEFSTSFSNQSKIPTALFTIIHTFQ